MGFLKSKRKVSLVLGSGGARGLVQIGVIQQLEEQGYVIDEIVGCSIGSLIGAAYAQGKLDELTNWMKRVTRLQVFKLMDFTNPKFGLLKGSKALESLKEVFPDTPIEDMKIRYTAVATDLKNETEVVFSKGKVYDAIRASISIPAVFTGVDLDNQYLVDGGVLNPLPISHVTKRRRNIVIAVNLDGKSDAQYGNITMNKKPSSIEALQEAYFVMRRRLGLLSIQMNKPDFVIDVPHNICGIWDYHRADFLIESGIALTEKIIPSRPKRR